MTRRLAAALLALAAALPGCSRPAPEGRFFLRNPALVSLEIFQAGDPVPLFLLDEEPLPAGPHGVELREGRLFLDGKARPGRLPAGQWRWRLSARGPGAAPIVRGEIFEAGWPASGGVPSALAADVNSLYLGSAAGQGSGALVALDAAGKVRWTHQREGLGVHALGADAGFVYVLADATRTGPASAVGGGVLYKLEAATGRPQSFEDAARSERLSIASLWPAQSDDTPEARPPTADALTASNGRLYLSFAKPGFVAVLDAKDGRYITTLSGPSPGQMALATTPIRDANGKEEIADFGIVVLAQSAFSYFVMPHDPPWVAYNTTRRMARGEALTAFTMKADTMKTGEIDLFVALAAPQAQVQRRLVSDPAGFNLALGKPGGRPQPIGPWEPQALGDVRALSVGPDARLWIAEGENCPPRFCAWSLRGAAPALEREVFSPSAGAEMRGAAIFPEDPLVVVAAGCEWQIAAQGGQARCAGVIAPNGMRQASFLTHNGRPLLVVGDDSPALSFYRRESAGVWRPVAQLDARAGRPPVYWADANGDGRRQSAELQALPSAPAGGFPDRALPGGVLGGAGAARYALRGSTPCGAPLFDWENPAPQPPAADPQRERLEKTLPPEERESLLQMPDGRAFALSREGNALRPLELEGARAPLGEGAWSVAAP